MEPFLQKYVWLIHLALIAVAAILLALAANRYVAIHLAPYTVPQLPKLVEKTDEPKRRAPLAAQKNYVRGITEQCLFGCPKDKPKNECPEEGCPDGEVCEEGQCVPEQPSQVDSELPVESDLNVKLLGGMVAKSPDFSMALLNDPSNKQTYIVGVGDYIMEDAEVVEILRDRIIFKRNGRLEFIRLEDTIQGNPSLTAAVGSAPKVRSPVGPVGKDTGKDGARRPTAKRKVRTKADDKEGVKKLGKNSFQLDRDSINEQLNDTKALAKQARIVPNFKDGKKHGIKLVGIAPGSVYSKIGIESGDVVVGINGKAVRSQNQALDLLNQLRKKNNVSIEIERRGQREKLKYEIK